MLGPSVDVLQRVVKPADGSIPLSHQVDDVVIGERGVRKIVGLLHLDGGVLLKVVLLNGGFALPHQLSA